MIRVMIMRERVIPIRDGRCWRTVHIGKGERGAPVVKDHYRGTRMSGGQLRGGGGN